MWSGLGFKWETSTSLVDSLDVSLLCHEKMQEVFFSLQVACPLQNGNTRFYFNYSKIHSLVDWADPSLTAILLSKTSLWNINALVNNNERIALVEDVHTSY